MWEPYADNGEQASLRKTYKTRLKIIHGQLTTACVLLEAVRLLVLRFPGDDVEVVLLSPDVALTTPLFRLFCPRDWMRRMRHSVYNRRWQHPHSFRDV